MTAPDWLVRAQAAAASQPHARTGPVPGRLLLIDGDALAYTCAGGEDPAQARINLRNHVEQAKRAASAEDALILLTARDSNKGGRYAVARVKPYQGQRSGDRRPPQWQHLRDLLEASNVGTPVESTSTAEADDFFAYYSSLKGPGNVVIHTQDKDMRMVPGWHLSWTEMRMLWLSPDTFAVEHNDKLYGEKWFWMQMLMGDTADNVPGLPKMTKPDGKQALCGEVTARKLLAECHDRDTCRAVVVGQYRSFYGDGWRTALLEQGVLLWMRRIPINVLDVAVIGRPLFAVCGEEAEQEILRRVTNATQS